MTGVDGAAVTVQFDRARYTAYEVVGRVARAYPVQDIETRDTPIEAIIRRIYTGDNAGATSPAPVEAHAR